MKVRGSRLPAAMAAVLLLLGAAGSVSAQTTPPDSLLLLAPQGVTARSVYDSFSRRFVVYISWLDRPDRDATLVHTPDTSGWSVDSPPAVKSVPLARGAYQGDIDRTIVFRALQSGEVGLDSVSIAYEVRREEHLAGRITLTPAYVPKTWLPVTLRDQRTNRVIDLGIEVRFSAGRIDAQGGFTLGLEDFEGFHVWRGLRPDGSDLEVIGELSKEEAFKGSRTGGSFPDSIYYYSVIPTLRQGQPWFSPFGAVECLGNRIDFPLESNEFFWFDCHAVNGFTYYYAVTSFDRGYNPGSSQQGLTKADHCAVAQGQDYPCSDELRQVVIEVDTQDDLYQVYAVPNPFRSGGSRLTTSNYHNFPDDAIRFVNVPPKCQLKIYTVSGDLVRELINGDHTGNIEWDTRNAGGEEVSSGVYVYRLYARKGESVYGRLTIVR